jgi:predicted phosphodiesterase
VVFRHTGVHQFARAIHHPLGETRVKIHVMSDLHVEFLDFAPPQVGANVVVLAGDIYSEHHGIAWARRAFATTQIVYVFGNHEFYKADYDAVLDRSRLEAAKLDVHLLECDEVRIDGVRFLGSTLWTDFEIDQTSPGIPSFPMWYANQNMSDFRLIRYRGRRLGSETTREFHQNSRRWLKERLAEPFSGRTVVVTHHLPHRDSINPRFHRDPLNPAFASHMPELVRAPVDLWIHGHTHCSCDYVTGETRVLCNPRGYGPYDINPNFDEALAIEL